ACGMKCPGTICAGGQCTSFCADSFEDCNKNLVLDGCEADIARDAANCGSCGAACPLGASCVKGACQCPAGPFDCDANPLNGCEAGTQVDPSNCGACGKSCGANQACAGGACACTPGFDDCNHDPDDGCEAPLDSPGNCGACGMVCGPKMVCAMGKCACADGF